MGVCVQKCFGHNKPTSGYLMSFVAIVAVSKKPEVVLLPKCRYNSPKHCAAPMQLYPEKLQAKK